MEEHSRRGSSTVYQRFISRTASALRSCLLTSVPTRTFLCKPFSCKACPGTSSSRWSWAELRLRYKEIWFRFYLLFRSRIFSYSSCAGSGPNHALCCRGPWAEDSLRFFRAKKAPRLPSAAAPAPTSYSADLLRCTWSLSRVGNSRGLRDALALKRRDVLAATRTVRATAHGPRTAKQTAVQAIRLALAS